MRPLRLLTALLLALPATAVAQAADSATALRELGKRVFEGRGLCFSCHGMQGEGIAAVGKNTILDDGKWLHSKGTQPELVALIKEGIDLTRSKGGVIMPPRGGSRISDREVEAVAAYVLQLAKKRPAP